ncbi:MAG: fibronectin type III domain-containing protein, partial [bacterium]|nr:fibronectin type III domain-containing protein [bacterium]
MNYKTSCCNLIFTVVLSILFVFSNAIADDLVVQWDPNSESDLKGYKIYYGTDTRSYGQIIDVGDTTSYTITDLTTGFEYFFAVTAYDTAGNESDFSEEASYFLSDPDTTAPTVLSAILVNETTLRINFSERVERSGAEDISNYHINNSIQINSATLDVNDQTVTLSTSSHPVGTYTLTINNIQDLADTPNSIAPNTQISYTQSEQTQFEIAEVIVIDTSHIEILFTKKLDNVTAEQSENYAIISGVTVLEAHVEPDEFTVLLTTTKHIPGQYALVVNNIKDQDPVPNTIANNTTYIYQVQDMTPPSIASIQCVDETRINVTFSEPVEKISAETKQNYQISPDIIISQAILSDNEKTVHLITSPHYEGQFSLQVVNISDKTNPPNTITSPVSKDYYYIDTIPPSIISVSVQSDTHLVVTFSEPVERISAETASNYQIFNDIRILSANLSSDNRSVHLMTTSHYEAHFILIADNIQDLAANPNVIDEDNNYWIYRYIDTIPPEITNVEALTDTLLELTFTEEVTRSSAEDIENYQILFGVTILSAELRTDNKTVWLKTTQHAPQQYVLIANNIEDRAQNPNTIAENTSYSYVFVDTQTPFVSKIEVLDRTRVDIIFNEPVNQPGAENIYNYSINKEIEVENAILNENEKTVHLTTSSHTEGEYQILINNIQDQADPPNQIEENSTYSYTFIDTDPPEVVQVIALDRDHVKILFSEEIERSSAENPTNYTIIDDISIHSAHLDSTDKVVYLVTSDHLERFYFISINNITDKAATPNTILPVDNYPYQYRDTTPPSVENVFAVHCDTVIINFSEPVEQASAENVANYSISGG